MKFPVRLELARSDSQSRSVLHFPWGHVGNLDMGNGFFLVNEPPLLLLEAVRLQQGSLRVGRSSSCEIFLPDKTVSRQHARIEVRTTGVIVHDLGSANGTFINDQRVITAPVVPGQHLRFGRVLFHLATDVRESLSRFDEASTMNLKPAGPTPILEAMRSLTPAQRTVLSMLLEGDSQKEIAKQQHLSIHTIHNHLRKIYAAFDVHSRAELLAHLLQNPMETQPFPSDPNQPD